MIIIIFNIDEKSHLHLLSTFSFTHLAVYKFSNNNKINKEKLSYLTENGDDGNVP